VKKSKVPRPKTDAQILLEIHLKELGLEFVPEAQFHPDRKWRFDYALGKKQAIEIEGAVWRQGRHTRGKGYMADMEKYREAAALGWRVYRFAPQEVLNGTARAFIERCCR
jgi:hypothetical protein